MVILQFETNPSISNNRNVLTYSYLLGLFIALVFLFIYFIFLIILKFFLMRTQHKGLVLRKGISYDELATKALSRLMI